MRVIRRLTRKQIQRLSEKLDINKIVWRVYKQKDKDDEVDKDALNATTNEVRKSKRNFEHKL